VAIYDQEHNLIKEIKDFNKPEAAVATNSEGTLLFVADRNENKVKIYELTTESYQLIATIEDLDHPEGIAVSRYKIQDTGYRIYVSDTGRHQVKVYELEEGSWQLIQTIGEYGTGQGQFNLPGGLFITEKGYLYVVDQNNNRVQKFDKYGNFLMQFGKIGNQDGQFNKPKDIVVTGYRMQDTGYRIYVADRNNNRIQIFTYSGTGGKLRLALFDKEKPEAPLTINEFYNYPNPFSPNNDGDRDETTIYFELSTQADVSIYIYNVVGKLVKIFDTIYNTTGGDLDSPKWDGRNDLGRVCANGVYIIYLKAKTSEGQTIEDVHKCAILK